MHAFAQVAAQRRGIEAHSSGQRQGRGNAPFAQGAGGASRGGVGLAIVQRHLELLGSRLEWESSSGQGSRFYFSIHLEPGAGSEEVDAGSPVRQVVAAGQEVRALVVDDVMENREVLQQILEQLGAQVEVAESGEQAIERMRQI